MIYRISPSLLPYGSLITKACWQHYFWWVSIFPFPPQKKSGGESWQCLYAYVCFLSSGFALYFIQLHGRLILCCELFWNLEREGLGDGRLAWFTSWIFWSVSEAWGIRWVLWKKKGCIWLRLDVIYSIRWAWCLIIIFFPTFLIMIWSKQLWLQLFKGLRRTIIEKWRVTHIEYWLTLMVEMSVPHFSSSKWPKNQIYKNIINTHNQPDPFFTSSPKQSFFPTYPPHKN